MRLAKLATIGIAAALVLSGCTSTSSKAGAAAYVSSTRISDSTVDSYLTKAGPDADKAATAAPRTTTLNELIQNELYTQSLAATGEVPTTAQLNAVHDDALTLLQQSQTLGADYDAALTKAAASYGLEASFATLALQTLELEYIYIQRSKVTTPDELAASISKLKLPVDVSTKYGAWNPSALSLDSSPSAGVPSFVNLAPSPVASAATG